jgi:hypothetical protein
MILQGYYYSNFTVIFVFYLTVKGLYIIVIVLEKGNMVNTLLFFHRVLDVYNYSVYMFKERIIIRVLYSLGYFHIYLLYISLGIYGRE